MKKIQIYGTGCVKCNQLTENAKIAIQEMGIECDISKVTDMKDIIAAGVMMTPGIAVDGVLKKSGKVLSVDEIKSLL